ncbi:hypothetical protein [Pseudomonas sp. UMAB-40]|uniref:hypothetical protein n=1 Tax=Pseudomonas sp. UMAB-40 TaxID=1365407 RepID=UPI001C593150|nr:hypothetical protein [Pseudomonas sp. UMAB-40]
MGKLDDKFCSSCLWSESRYSEGFFELDDNYGELQPALLLPTRKLTLAERLEWWAGNANTSMCMRFYIVGLDCLLIPRKWRRLFARTEWHRAWLNGYMAIYRESGEFHGVCQRDWMCWRRRPDGAPDDNMWLVLKHLAAPWSRPIPVVDR